MIQNNEEAGRQNSEQEHERKGKFAAVDPPELHQDWVGRTLASPEVHRSTPAAAELQNLKKLEDAAAQGQHWKELEDAELQAAA